MPGDQVSEVTEPRSPLPSPRRIETTGFDVAPHTGDRYGVRVRGYVHPPVSGVYTFWVAGDDTAVLYVSPDSSPTSKRVVATVPAATGVREWTKFPSQRSVGLRLESGKRYYVEAYQKELYGGDHLSVGWTLPTGVDERPLPAHRVSAFDPATDVTRRPPVDETRRGVTRDYWTGLGRAGFTSLLGDPRFPGAPSGSHLVGDFEGPTDVADYYGDRMRALVYAPATGDYRFWIAADSSAELYLSSDEDAGNKRRIAFVDRFTGRREWTKYPSQLSEPIRLVAGRRYYLESLHYEGDVGDHLSVGWTLPDGQLERPIKRQWLYPPPPATAAAAPRTARGSIRRDFWGGVVGSSVTDLARHQKFPFSPSGSGLVNSFEGFTNASDLYGSRFSGYVHAPVTGDYTFWVSGDSSAELFVSPSADRADKVLVAHTSAPTAPREWTKSPSQRSRPVKLVAGGVYYVELLHKESDGGDNVAAGWTLPDGTEERPIPGARLSPAPALATPPTAAPDGRGLRREVWGGIPGSTIDSLMTSWNYQNRPSSGVSVVPNAEAPSDASDYFGSKLNGYVLPPETGLYTFYLSGDDQAELYLSTDGATGNKRRVAWLGTASGFRDKSRFPSQTSRAVPLEAGKAYYIEVLHKENSGADHLSVGWKLPNGTVDLPISRPFLAPFDTTAPLVLPDGSPAPAPGPAPAPAAPPTPTPGPGSGAPGSPAPVRTPAPGSTAPVPFACADPDSLAPYRESLTPAEVRHVLSRAFGGTPSLYEVGTTRGLTALLDAMYAQPETGVEARAVAAAAPELKSTMLASDMWVPEAGRNYWLTYMLEGNRLKEYTALVLYNWFPVNTNRFFLDGQRDHYIREYLDKIRSGAVGDVRTLLRSLFSDGAMNVFLNNRLNAVGAYNLDMARELMELFTLDTVDEEGRPNYSETDVFEMARSITGFREECPATGCSVRYDPARFDNSLKVLFPGQGGTAVANFDWASAGDRILFGHRAAARYVARRLFTVFVHDHPGTAAVDELTGHLMASDFDVTGATRKLLSSCAFFSPDAHDRYFTTPVDFMVGLANALGMPASRPEGLAEIRRTFRESGQNPLEYPSIFGLRTGGLTGGELNVGDVAQSAQAQLEMTKGVTRLLVTMRQSPAAWSPASLLSRTDGAEKAVETFAGLLGVSLRPAEFDALVTYMNTRNTAPAGSPPVPVAAPWDAATGPEGKLFGLVEILTSHPDFRRN